MAVNETKEFRHAFTRRALGNSIFSVSRSSVIVAAKRTRDILSRSSLDKTLCAVQGDKSNASIPAPTSTPTYGRIIFDYEVVFSFGLT